MTGKIIDKLFISLGLDTEGVQKGMEQATKSVTSGLKSMLSGAVMPALGALASSAFLKGISDEVGAIDRLSKSLGINIEQLHAWQGAAELSGVEADEIGELFADLNDWMVDSVENQSGALNEFVEKKWLPAVTTAEGKMKDTQTYALELADALKALGEQPGSGVARQIGISNATVAAFLQQGSAPIRAKIEQIKRMGTYTEQDAKASRELNAALKEMSWTLKTAVLPVFRFIAPLVAKFAEAVVYLTKHTVILIPPLVGVAAVLLGRMLPALKAVTAQAMKLLLSPWGALLAALVGIGLAIDDLLTWMKGGKSLFGDFWTDLFGSPDGARASIQSVKDALSSAAEVAASVWNAIRGVFETGYKTIQKKMAEAEKILGRFGDAFQELGSGIASVAKGIIGVFGDLASYIASCIVRIQNYLKPFVALFRDIGGVLGKVFGGIGGALTGKYVADGRAANALPPSVVNGGSTTDNRQTQNTVNVTIEGNATPETIDEAYEGAGGLWSMWSAQANASQ